MIEYILYVPSYDLLLILYSFVNRNKLPGPPGNVPQPGVEYGCPPVRPPGMPVENGYRDDNVSHE